MAIILKFIIFGNFAINNSKPVQLVIASINLYKNNFMSTQKEGTAKVDESVVNQPANSAATTAPKKRRRGISNETRTTSRKKFSHKDAINNLWLFVGHLHARVAWVTMKEDNNMRPAFAGKAIPQLVIEATSLHTNPADVRVASKTFWPYESNVDYIPGGAKEKFINMDFAWIKHFLDVVVFKGREMTDEESEMLELGYVDYDDNGQYEPVEVEDVIKAWGVLFDNVVKLVETGGENSKSALLDKVGNQRQFWFRLNRYYKNKGDWAFSGQGSEEGDLVFPNIVGQGIFEEKFMLDATHFKEPSLMFDITKERIAPMDGVQSKQKKAPNLAAAPGIGGIAMGAGIVQPNMGGMPNFGAAGGFNPTEGSAFAPDSEDNGGLPF
mgnify:FL=1